MTPPTGQPSDADLARATEVVRDLFGGTCRHTRMAATLDAVPCGRCPDCLRDWRPEAKAIVLAAVRDRDARIAAARAEHQPTHVMWDGTRREVCRTCDHDDDVPVLWPCPTIAALDGPQ